MFAIIGSQGQLGWELVRQAGKKGLRHLALDFPEIDIRQLGEPRDHLAPQKPVRQYDPGYAGFRCGPARRS